MDLPRAKWSLWFNPELLEPGRRTQGVCTKGRIQLSAIKAQVLLPFQGHLEPPGSTWPKFPLSPWGVKTWNEENAKWRKEKSTGRNLFLRPILFICFQEKKKREREMWKFLFRHFLMTWDDPVKQMRAARRVLCSERAGKYLPMQQLCKRVRLLSS